MRDYFVVVAYPDVIPYFPDYKTDYIQSARSMLVVRVHSISWNQRCKKSFANFSCEFLWLSTESPVSITVRKYAVMDV